MLRIKMGVIALLLSLGLNGAGAAGCGTKQSEPQQNVNQTKNNNAPVTENNNAPASSSPERTGDAVEGEMKVLAEGAYGKITDPFVVVARDAETYAALRELLTSLPQLNGEFFKKNLVVAAFLGQRNTGGYSVQITRGANNRLLVSSASPPAGAMLTQALTAPFKIISTPINDERPPGIEIDPTWNEGMRPYRLASGEFTTGGGFAGRFEKLQLTGEIRVSRLGKLATFLFDLKSTGGTKARLLQDAASGLVAAGGGISGVIVDAGSLVDFPRSALGSKGSFTRNEDKLSLTFESLPSNVSDGYGGRGQLEANATAPPPPKKTTSDDDPA